MQWSLVTEVQPKLLEQYNIDPYGRNMNENLNFFDKASDTGPVFAIESILKIPFEMHDDEDLLEIRFLKV